MLSRKSEGLIAAPFTPLAADGSIRPDAIGPYIEWLISRGVGGAFICGTTGEGLSLSVEERCRIAETWMQAAPAGFRVLVHVGHQSLPDCRALAAHAESIQADSFACMAPNFFKPGSVRDLVAWCAEVASAAPSLPFYYYHIPSMTGVELPVHEFLEAVGERIPNLVGIKFTHDDLDDFGRCLKVDGGRFDMLFGRDEILLDALKLGATGAVGSTYNFASPIFRSVIEHFRKSDLAAAEQEQATASQLIRILTTSEVHPIAAFKWFMNRLGFDVGPPRLPLSGPSEQQREELEAKLVKTGIFRRLGAADA